MSVNPQELSRQLIEIAYKKLKASAYYDKTQGQLRDAIVHFESTDSFKQFPDDIMKAMTTEKTWRAYTKPILDSICFLMVPKKISARNDDGLVINHSETIPHIEDFQYYIDMNVIGHVLGVLWLMTIGYIVDQDVYEHSYGNRLHRYLFDENECVTFSPTLFEPYIQQYGTWRDRALQIAEEHLKGHEDVFILTMDFQRFFYHVDISQKKYDALLPAKSEPWIKQVHTFVWDVLQRYSQKLNGVVLKQEKESKECLTANGTLLPIGFLPSNVLSNWVLAGFDKAIIDRWNPLYYGRYVDDVIIVEKLEKGSDLYQRARGQLQEPITAQYIVEHYLCNCRNRCSDTPCVSSVLKKDEIIGAAIKSENSSIEPINPEMHDKYYVTQEVIGHENTCLAIQSKKLKAFYFVNGSSTALLTRFREDIARNASEFRTLPDLDDVLQYGNYSRILNLKREDTINKLRGIKSVTVDRFELSKFLGKYAVVSSLIETPTTSAFERDLFSIFDETAILENYTLWDRILEILVIGENWNGYTDMVQRILTTIEHIESGALECAKTLRKYLHAAIARSSALCWTQKMNEALASIHELSKQKGKESLLPSVSFRKEYLHARMVSKTAIPILLDGIDTEAQEINYTSFASVMTHIQQQPSDITLHKLYPYWVKPQEIAFVELCKRIACGTPIPDDQEMLNMIHQQYWQMNYPYSTAPDEALRCVISGYLDLKRHAIFVHSDAKKTLRIAIGNAKIPDEAAENTLKGKPNLTLKRYEQFAHIMDEAIREKCDMLVLPELFLPIEWLPAIARKCADVQMALVTGLDFVLGGSPGEYQRPVYNLTATILPYMHDQQKHAYISYHHKVHYAPAEEELIRKYGFQPKHGSVYQLYGWHEIWFPVYCCFELASIQDRALFRSMCDMTIGVEWNKDTHYYEHLTNALSRDLHCYVIEANTAQYGGSSVIQPQSSVTSELLRTKGGDNYVVLTTSIDIQALREAQYPVTGDRKPFKPLPPMNDEDRRYIVARYRGTLWDVLVSQTSNK